MAIMYSITLLVLAIAATTAYHGDDLPPGPYCGKSSYSADRCCQNRQDACSHRILDTLCYCDEFCNRTRAMDDCCPDYEEVCLGIIALPIIKGKCRPGQTKMEGCNKCECDEVDNTLDWVCEQDECIISDQVIRDVNGGGNSWRAANYTEYRGKKLKEGLKYRLGTLPISIESRRMHPIQYDKVMDYPREFDARRRWPQYVSPVIDQGWCGSDWAVSIAGIISDRFAIQSNGAERMLISPQSLLSCNVRGQQGCDGGYIDVAWNFAGQYGLVDEDCLPYTAKNGKCPYKIKGNLIEAGCRPQTVSRTSKYKVGPPYRLRLEEDIMYEIMESGPMQAVMTVYQDFFHYRDGVYRHTHSGDQRLEGLHSVRLLGWGEERGDKFWIVANSWGPEWGENGYFRIARGSDESGIESFVISVLSDVNEANLKK